MEKIYIKELTCGNVTVVENKSGQWAVINSDGEVVVPFGKYAWIDGFDHGLARVRTDGLLGWHGGSFSDFHLYAANVTSPFKEETEILNDIQKDRKEHPQRYAKWGIINEKGEEVLPVEYDSVWNFYGKKKKYTKVEKDGEAHDVYFDNLNPSHPSYERRTRNYSDDYGSHYGEFAGTYAQDVMGYSDDVINDAFDGDPDAYWNID